MIGLIVDDTYPSHRHTSVTWSGTGHSSFGHTANKMFNRKNGDQHNTNVKNTTPNTLLAFCSVRTALAAAKLWRFCLLARNLLNNDRGYVNGLGKKNFPGFFRFWFRHDGAVIAGQGRMSRGRSVAVTLKIKTVPRSGKRCFRPVRRRKRIIRKLIKNRRRRRFGVGRGLARVIY